MKKPEEIKKGLRCPGQYSGRICETCPYSNDGRDCGENGSQVMDDALAYIQQLEAELTAVKRERDAVAKDLKSACRLLWSDDSMQCCKFCERKNDPKDSGYCDKCNNGNRFKFKPAALCPENTEV